MHYLAISIALLALAILVYIWYSSSEHSTDFVSTATHCTKPYYDRGAGQAKICPAGTRDIGGVCYEPENCPADHWEEDGSHCRKKTYERSVTGKVCPAGSRDVGGVCYTPADCGSPWTDTGGHCTKPSYLRPAGVAKICPTGTRDVGGICYTPKDCPTSFWEEDGAFCKRKTYNRPAGVAPAVCPTGSKLIGTKCYAPAQCPTDWRDDGTTCYQELKSNYSWACPTGWNCASGKSCPSGWRDDGATCYHAGHRIDKSKTCPSGYYSSTAGCQPNDKCQCRGSGYVDHLGQCYLKGSSYSCRPPPTTCGCHGSNYAWRPLKGKCCTTASCSDGGKPACGDICETKTTYTNPRAYCPMIGFTYGGCASKDSHGKSLTTNEATQCYYGPQTLNKNKICPNGWHSEAGQCRKSGCPTGTSQGAGNYCNKSSADAACPSSAPSKISGLCYQNPLSGYNCTGVSCTADSCPADTTWDGSRCRKSTKSAVCGSSTPDLQAGLCYENPRSGHVCNGTLCIKQGCPAGTVDKGATCAKNTTDKVCPNSHPVEEGGTCYDAAARAGYSCNGKTCRYKTCPTGTTDRGITCEKSRNDNKVCGSGRVDDVASDTLCYTKPRDGYRCTVTSCVYDSCPPNTTDRGVTCEKDFYTDGETKGRICKPGYAELSAGLCYPTLATLRKQEPNKYKLPYVCDDTALTGKPICRVEDCGSTELTDRGVTCEKKRYSVEPKQKICKPGDVELSKGLCYPSLATLIAGDSLFKDYECDDTPLKGKPLCRTKDCGGLPGLTDVGLSCEREHRQNPGKAPSICAPGYEEVAGSCWPVAQTGFACDDPKNLASCQAVCPPGWPLSPDGKSCIRQPVERMYGGPIGDSYLVGFGDVYA